MDLHADELLLRLSTLDDAEEYFPLVPHPDILRFTGENPQHTQIDGC